MSDEQVQWQETILHTGTVEERDAAYAAFRDNPNGQYFVHGGPRADKAHAKPEMEKQRQKFKAHVEESDQPKASERVDDLNRRMAEARAKRAAGNHSKPTYKVPAPVKPETAATEAERALKAFMGHGPS